MTDEQTTFTCPECGDAFPTREELDRHEHAMPLAWERGATPFQCPMCGIGFDEADELVTHQATAHPGENAPDDAGAVT
jgi:predicted RNA-binding Zn-ribbon protein involved in translation (DUF1610 family)